VSAEPAEPVFAIVGPTASGKTGAAIAVAERIGAEIVSCDSLQLYRELDIGTAKPTAAEQARVPHHLIDVLAPDESCSAARFAELAERAIADIRGRGRRVLVVGGSGLYFRALRFGLFAAPPRDDELRAGLLAEERAQPGRLHERLRAVDEVAAARIAPADLVRLVRALEVFELTGRPLTEHHAEHRQQERTPMAVFQLDPPFEVLDPRIAARVESMLAAGLVDETRRVIARYGAAPPLQSVGYAEVCQLLAGQLRAEELAPAIVRATRRYARRQRTWFKKEPGARRFDSADELTRAIDAACRP
jgi:tRNA dimethylallyltransferase